MKNREIEAGAKAIANDLQLPGGRRKKLARVVAEHLEWFDLSEARGLTWDDMIAALAAAGVRRDNGLPLSRGALSSAVWRKRQESSVAPGRSEERSGQTTRGASATRPSSRLNRPSAQPKSVRSGKDHRPSRKALSRQNLAPAGRLAVSGKRDQEGGASNAVLTYMQRAARLRRNADEMD